MSGNYLREKGIKYSKAKKLAEKLGVEFNLKWQRLSAKALDEALERYKAMAKYVRENGREYLHTYYVSYTAEDRHEDGEGELKLFEDEITIFSYKPELSNQEAYEKIVEVLEMKRYDTAPESNIYFQLIKTEQVYSEQTLKDVEHYSSSLVYPLLGAMTLGGIPGLCGYEAIRQRTGASMSDVKKVIGKNIHEGLTANNFKTFYEQLEPKVGLYCFDLLMNTVTSVVLPQDMPGRDRKIDVYLFANCHVYVPDEEGTKALMDGMKNMTMTPDMDTVKQKALANPREIIRIAIDDPAAAVAEAVRLAEALNAAAADSARRCEEVERDFETRTSALLERIPISNSPEARITRKEIKAQIRTLKRERTMTTLRLHQQNKQDRLTSPKTNIYTTASNLNIQYYEFLRRGIVYGSDFDGDNCQRLSLHKQVQVYCNEAFGALEQSSKELGIPYSNQASPQLAKIYFEKLKESGQWESSVMNNQVAELLRKNKVGGCNWSNEYIEKPTHKLVGVDGYRQYASVAMEGDFYTCDVDAEWAEPTDLYFKSAAVNNFDAYLFYIEAIGDQTVGFPFSGNGVYDYKIVQEGIGRKLISLENIKYVMSIKKSPNNNKLIKTYIKDIYSKVSDDKIRKQLVNCLIGKFGSMNGRTYSRALITDNKINAGYLFHKIETSDPKNRIMKTINLRQPDGDSAVDEVYYVAGFETPAKMTTDILIRNAIVQRGTLATYRLMRDISEHPHVSIVAVKTDCVIYSIPTKKRTYPVPKPGASYTFGAVRPQFIPVKSLEEHKTPLATSTYELKYTKWNTSTDGSETENFDLNNILKFKRAFVRGHAGTGKSYLANMLTEKLRAEGRKPVTCAFTHVAGLIIGGQTLHSLLGISTTGAVHEAAIQRLFGQFTDIVIDEVSMVPLSIYRLLVQIPQRINIYGFGDFHQFEPVCEGKSKYFETVMFRGLFENLITLRKQYRAHGDYADQSLARFYAGPKAPLPSGVSIASATAGDLPDFNLSFTNAKRIEINTAKMAQVAAGLNIECSAASARVTHKQKPIAGELNMTEVIDCDKLAYIVRNPDQFNVVDTRQRDTDVFRMAHMYLALVTDQNGGRGTVEVSYKQSANRMKVNSKAAEPEGRYYSKRSLSLQNITRQIRHTIARDHYYDIDMENCHPRVLQFLCKKNNIKSPQLDKYVDDREPQLARLMKQMKRGRGEIKTMLLAILNGGAKAYKEAGVRNAWVEAFIVESKMIHSSFAQLFPDRFAQQVLIRQHNNKDYNIKASFTNVLMCEMENAILMCMFNQMKKDKLLGANGKSCVLCFDGIMILKDSLDGLPGDPALYIKSIEDIITAKLGIAMPLTIKTMDEHLELPEVIPKFTGILDSESHIVNSLAEHFDEFKYLYAGMPVIANVNKRALKKAPSHYFNNERFTVVGLGESKVFIKHNKTQDEQTVAEAEFRRNFRPAYCMTGYKSQGMTIITPYRVHEFDRFNVNGQYVVLTRASDPALVSVVSNLPATVLAITSKDKPAMTTDCEETDNEATDYDDYDDEDDNDRNDLGLITF